MDTDKTIYICKLILCLGNKHIINSNNKQELWDLWIKIRNCLFQKNDKLGVVNIFKSVYQLKNYDPDETINKWGCIGDIYCLKSDIKILDNGDIYSPIQIIFESYGYLPLNWCKYMQSKGFIINLYFLNLDSNKLYITKNCGNCLYSFNNLVFENYCKIPKIDYKFKRYTSKNRIDKYIQDKYAEERICYELNLLLELYEIGFNFVANKIYKELTSLPKLIENINLNDSMEIDDINLII